MGTLLNVKSTPRHLLMTPDQKKLIVSSNVSGFITTFDLNILLNDLIKADGKRIQGTAGKEVSVGLGAPTIEVEPQGRYVYAAINNDVKVVAISLETMKVVSEVKVDPFARFG